MSANDKQIAGSHYKSKSECWDYIIDNNLGYLEGTAIKYLTRWRKKNGIEDLRKAIHFIEKLIEVEESKKENPEYKNSVLAGYQKMSPENKAKFDLVNKMYSAQIAQQAIQAQQHWTMEDVMKAWGAKAQADKAYEDWLKEKENVSQHRGA